MITPLPECVQPCSPAVQDTERAADAGAPSPMPMRQNCCTLLSLWWAYHHETGARVSRSTISVLARCPPRGSCAPRGKHCTSPGMTQDNQGTWLPLVVVVLCSCRHCSCYRSFRHSFFSLFLPFRVPGFQSTVITDSSGGSRNSGRRSGPSTRTDRARSVLRAIAENCYNKRQADEYFALCNWKLES